jgi:ligand-binding sensor domain-containing protein/serine phosphatase RsbU (regulator of sigma subunit)
MLKLLIALAFVVSLPTSVAAQGDDPPAPKPKFDHDIERSTLPKSLSVERVGEGLIISDTTAIVQDGTGFLWVGGQEGLARFDGHELTFVSGDAAAASGFGGHSVTSMTVDKAGKLYVGTYEKGLYVYDPALDKFEVLEGPRDSNSITAVYADLDDNLWVGYTEGGYAIRKAGGAWIEVKGTEETPLLIKRFLQTKAGYWLATAGSGLLFRSALEGGEERIYSTVAGDFDGTDEQRYLPSDSIADIAVDQDGSIWVATSDEGLCHVNPETHELKSYTADDSKRSITANTLTTLAIDEENNLYVGSTVGFALFDRKAKDFHQYFSSDVDPTTIPFNWVTASFVDAGGIVWLGHFQNGLAKFHPSQFETPLYRAANGTLSITPAGNTMWTGTYDGLWAYDWAKETLTKFHEFRSDEGDFPLDGVWVTSVIVDESNGSVWASTLYRGLVHFHPVTGDFEYFDTENSDIASDNIKSMVKGPKGNIWIGTFDAGLVRLNVADASWKSFSETEIAGLSSAYVSVVQLDRDGKHVWFGATDSLVKLNFETMQSTAYVHSPNDATTLPSGQVYALWQTEDTMWIGTAHGLAEMNLATGTVRRYTKEDGLAHDQVSGVVESDGAIWLSTNGGGIQHLDQSRTTFTSFVTDDGMQGMEYAQGSYAKLDDGSVVLGGIKGFNKLSAKTLKRNAHDGALVFTGVEVGNQPYDFGRSVWNAKSISMDHASGIVKFRFASLNYDAPQQTRYKFRLKGWETEWQEVGAEQRFASYTNLDGGDYTFEVMARERGGEWSPVRSLKLDVAPPLWKTWWAGLIYLTVIALVVVAYLRYQRQKLYSLEQEAKANKAENDLELTGAVQMGFLPRESSVSTESFGLLGYYRPAESCSGDWWWHEKQPDGRHTVLVGDVTGHGPGPAMVTAAVATAYRVQSLAHNSTMDSRLRVLNDEVLRVSGGKYQMTLTAFTIDTFTGEFEIHSAGGLPVMKHEQANAKANSLPCRGTPLGTEELVIGNLKGQLNPGSRVIVFTDGIPEIDMPNGRQIGMRRFASLFADSHADAVPLATRKIVQTAEKYLEDRPQDDDWTFVILDWQGPETRI